MKSTLVVEDQEPTREWLAALAAEAFPETTVHQAATLAQSREHLKRSSVDLALVDINLPDGSGIELVSQLASESPDTYSVITTIFDDDKHLFAALQAGAQGYLLKEQPRERLLAQLEGIVNGEPPLSPAIARRILQHFNQPGNGQEEDTIALSERETEVLTLIAKGLSRSDISRLLGITANTAAGYIKTIYRKLNISSRAEAVLEAVRMGLINTARW